MPVFDRTTQDVGNMVELGHVNVRVPDQLLATVFYVSGLGLTRDPYLMTGVDNMWVNVGIGQFHLPVGPAQVLNGVTGLVLPDLDALVRRLKQVTGRLHGTHFAFKRRGDVVDVTCPWGNRIRVHAPDPAQFGRIALGMPYVEVMSKRKSSPGIVRFYREIIGVNGSIGKDSKGAFARIPIGAGEYLLYRETADTPPEYDGHHIQVAFADFSGPHAKLLARGLITEESNESQYRFQDIVDLDSGDVLATIEHEVRSMRHPMYARALVNRDAAVTNNFYAASYQAARVTLEPG
jgi:predicted enzyme related to lactoylglutathione lyase